MAATKKLYDIKLQVRVENGTTTTGAKALKSLNLNQIRPQTSFSQRERQWRISRARRSPGSASSTATTSPTAAKA